MGCLVSSLSPSSTDSGKGRSKSSSVRVPHGFHLVEGKSGHDMEDYHVAEYRKRNNHVLGLFAIFDGHPGDRVPCYLKQHLFNNILQEVTVFTATCLLSFWSSAFGWLVNFWRARVCSWEREERSEGRTPEREEEKRFIAMPREEESQLTPFQLQYFWLDDQPGRLRVVRISDMTAESSAEAGPMASRRRRRRWAGERRLSSAIVAGVGVGLERDAETKRGAEERESAEERDAEKSEVQRREKVQRRETRKHSEVQRRETRFLPLLCFFEVFQEQKATFFCFLFLLPKCVRNTFMFQKHKKRNKFIKHVSVLFLFPKPMKHKHLFLGVLSNMPLVFAGHRYST